MSEILRTSEWFEIRPDLPSDADREQLIQQIKLLSVVPPFEDLERRLASVDRIRKPFFPLQAARGGSVLNAAVLVLSDLVEQGWSCRYSRGKIQLARPAFGDLDRDRIRQQLHVQRDKYLATAPVREFISALERRRLWRGKWVSIFSLMRDGVELADSIKKNPNDLGRTIRPYIQVVTADGKCEHTGLNLVDIWRYFRSTWANRYKSVPGRSLMLMFRDSAAEHHPVIGIAALGSSAVQISIRDKWIGWMPEQCVAELREKATDNDVQWLVGLVENGLKELYVEDLFDDSVSDITIKSLQEGPGNVLRQLRRLARDEKQKHFRLVNGGDHKSPELDKLSSAQRWQRQAELPLFRSKRADLLAMLLRAKAVLANNSCLVTCERFKALLANPDNRQAIQSLILRAKSERVGVAVADITICGAVAPYSHLLGGKLVAMLTASPEVVSAYRARYERYESVIASSLAGRPIIRRPDLVFLGTTSLYGTEPTQYTRVHIPCERVGGEKGQSVRFRLLGSTCGYGTFQFSDETIAALEHALEQSTGGQRVNSIFGEGTSPLMRKIRNGLDLLNMPSDDLLLHGNTRLVYGVSLVRNLKRFLLGQDRQPEYLIPTGNPEAATEEISRWWIERWLRPRIQRSEVLDRLVHERLTYPIKHSARVNLPPTNQSELPFEV